jgi:Protein of unknown function (DUF760)
MIQKFAMTAPNNVQEAAKSTVVNILGNLPNYALAADLITTSSKLSNLLHQMQMTGYMFKNAEYRMSFTLPLKGQFFSVVELIRKFLQGTLDDTHC